MLTATGYCAAEEVAAAAPQVETAPSAPAAHADALFAPGTSSDYMEQVDAALARSVEQIDAAASDAVAPTPFDTFQASNRWTRTALEGSGLTWGEGTTITWSIAPDGTDIAGFAGEAAGDSNFVAFMNSRYGSRPGGVENQSWFPLVESVFDRWSEVSGINFVYESHDDGAAFSSSSSKAPGVDGVRGDIRIGGHRIDGSSGTLAYNFFPNNGEMVLDTADSFFNNTAGNSLRLRNVLSHELGHGLGLSHVSPVDGSKLMEPYASTAFDGPQHDDILAVNRLYGDANEGGAGNDTASRATSLGTLNSGTRIVGDNSADQYVSIDGASDTDYYRFTASAGTVLDATLTPVGATYPQGPQGGAASSFNSRAQNNLRMDLYDANFRLIASANRTGLGGAETFSDVRLSATGQYYFRVSGDRDAAQLYELAITTAGGQTGVPSIPSTPSTPSTPTVPTAPTGALDFGDFRLDAYGNGQDLTGTATVENGGASAHLRGNRWKKIDFNYTITPNTVLEFDFSSSAQGEIHGIGFDSDTAISADKTFRVHGTQNWGIGDFDNYSGGTQHYVIPVGQFYTGDVSMLQLTNDHDVANPTADSVFSNVRVYESGGAGGAPQGASGIDFSKLGVQSYGGNQDISGSAAVFNAGSSLKLTGNVWKKVALPYTITPNTVVEFDFASNSPGEIFGIGLDTDDSISPERTFRVDGTQNWGIGAFAASSATAGTQHFVIPVGQFYSGAANNMFFVNDHDVSNPTAQSVFSNVRIYEAPSSMSQSAQLAGLAESGQREAHTAAALNSLERTSSDDADANNAAPSGEERPIDSPAVRRARDFLNRQRQRFEVGNAPRRFALGDFTPFAQDGDPSQRLGGWASAVDQYFDWLECERA